MTNREAAASLLAAPHKIVARSERPGKFLLCIEIKSTKTVDETDIRSFIKITKDIPNCEAIVLSQDRFLKKYEHVTCYPWKQGIAQYFPKINFSS